MESEHEHEDLDLEDKPRPKEFDLPSDRYVVLDFIGEGNFGKVYLVRAASTNKRYALKQIDSYRQNLYQGATDFGFSSHDEVRAL